MADGFTLEWNDKALLKNVAKIADIKTRAGAELVLKDAQRKVKKGKTKTLVGEIEVHRGKFKSGGDWVVEAQGTGNYTKYYAIFVELGHFSSVWGKYVRPKGGGALTDSPVKIPKSPYLRPSLNKNKRKIVRSFTNALDKMGVKENW